MGNYFLWFQTYNKSTCAPISTELCFFMKGQGKSEYICFKKSSVVVKYRHFSYFQTFSVPTYLLYNSINTWALIKINPFGIKIWKGQVSVYVYVCVCLMPDTAVYEVDDIMSIFTLYFYNSSLFLKIFMWVQWCHMIKLILSKNHFLWVVWDIAFTGFVLFLIFIWTPEIYFICNEKRELLKFMKNHCNQEKFFWL